MPKRRRGGQPKAAPDRNELKRRLVDLLVRQRLSPAKARKLLKVRKSTVYQLLRELVEIERAIRPLKGTYPVRYGPSINGSMYKLDSPHWRPGGMLGAEAPAPPWTPHDAEAAAEPEPVGPGEPVPETRGDGRPLSESPPTWPPRPPRLPMLAEVEPGAPMAAAAPLTSPKTIVLANLQFAAPVVAEPDQDKWGGLYAMEGDDWRARGWDRGWVASGVVFRRKIIDSPEFGPVTVTFAKGPEKFGVSVSLDRQVVHAYRLKDKVEFYGDVVQGIFKHLAKTTGYGFGLIRQTSEEEFVDPYPEMDLFPGGPLVVRASDGTEYKVDKSRGPVEGQTKGPRGAEAMEALLALPYLKGDIRKLGERLDSQTLVLVQVEGAMRALVETQGRTNEMLKAAADAQARVADVLREAFAPPLPPRNGGDRRGYQ